MDLHELKHRLEADPLRVAAYLLPNGKKVGEEWEAGSIAGEAGRSLKVRVAGPKAGCWADFAAGQAGDLVDLWRTVRGVPLTEALKEMRAWLGVREPEFTRPQAKAFRRPALRGTALAPQNPVMRYLVEERRIPPEILARYGVRSQGREIVLPSYRNGELLAVKYIGLDRTPDGKKVVRVEAGAEPCLWGWQAIPGDARAVVLVEGEIDAMSMAAYGWPALSVPFGGGGGAKQQWIEHEHPHLERFDTVYLAMDRDPEGQKAQEALLERLGRHRTRAVSLPYKDANECLQSGLGAPQMASMIEGAKIIDPPGLRNAVEFLGEVREAFYPSHDQEPGYGLPWSPARGKVWFRPGEVSIWTGNTGTGKSMAQGYAVLGMIREGARVCVASLEMSPVMTLKRLVKQATGLDRPSREYLDQVLAWLGAGLWLFDLVGRSRVERLLEVFEHARRRYGCDVFALDSVMRLGVATDDYRGMEEAMLRLVDFAVESRTHLHVVAHSRKAGGADGSPGTQIKGTSALGDNAANILEVARAWDKEKKGEMLRETGGDLSTLDGKPDARLLVQKQRNGQWTGSIPLWFDKDSLQYRERPHHPPVEFVPFRSGHANDDSQTFEEFTA